MTVLTELGQAVGSAAGAAAGGITGPLASFAKDLLDRVLPDPALKAQAQAQAFDLLLNGDYAAKAIQAANLAQLDVDKAEAASTDPLQHWRGGLGWVVVAGYAWNFVIAPAANAIGAACGHSLALPPMDTGPLATLTLGMLGLGGLHVAERVKGAA